MVLNHVFISLCWIVYCFLHSFLANDQIKESIYNKLAVRSNIYRILYNVFAIVTLVPLVIYQFSVNSIQLFHNEVVSLYIAVILIVTGLIIMLICVGKYFTQLSGLSKKHAQTEHPVLETSGIHKYVRHPLYFGTFIFLIGLFAWSPLLSHAIAVFIIIAYTIIGIRFEEKKLVKIFGSAYNDYQSKVPMIVPFSK